MESTASPLALHILLVDPRAYERPALMRRLRETHAVTVAFTGEEAVQVCRQDSPSLIIVDAGEHNIEILGQIEEYDKQTSLLLVGEHPDDEYEGEGFEKSSLKSWVNQALVGRRLHLQTANLAAPEQQVQTFGRFLTCCQGIVDTFRVLKRVAGTEVPILITGESGTGKELIARGIHEASDRKDKPFVALNCAAIPENLLETELFGYEKGAFTGATSTKLGKLEHAGAGTLFLDEIGDMPLATQAKILRVLEERTFERVGGHQSHYVRARIVAATNKNLTEAMQARIFREDLFYRLNTIHVELPPLRERREDIPLLIGHFLKNLSERYGSPARGVSPAVAQTLQRYDWPGNVRELFNCMHHAVLLCDDPRIELRDLPAAFQPGLKATILLDQVGKVPLDTIVEQSRRDLERQIITLALEKFRYNRARAAYYLGIDRKTLYRKMKELEISGDQPETGLADAPECEPEETLP